MRTLIGIATGIAFLAVVLLGSQDLVWAGGGGPPASCTVTKGKGRIIEGTIAVSSFETGAGMESILRLEYRGMEQFFRGTTGAATTEQQLVCDSLDTALTEPDPITGLGKTIKQAFSIPDAAQLVLRCEALPEALIDCRRAIRHASTLGIAPEAPFGLSTGLADIRITVLLPGGGD